MLKRGHNRPYNKTGTRQLVLKVFNFEDRRAVGDLNIFAQMLLVSIGLEGRHDRPNDLVPE